MARRMSSMNVTGFNNRKQEPHESIDVYATALRALAATCDTCEFGTLKDEIIRDRLVCGIAENSVRRKLLQEPKLTLASVWIPVDHPKLRVLILRRSVDNYQTQTR